MIKPDNRLRTPRTRPEQALVDTYQLDLFDVAFAHRVRLASLKRTHLTYMMALQFNS